MDMFSGTSRYKKWRYDIHFVFSSHVETCVLLSRETYRQHDTKEKIDIDLDDYYRIKEGKVRKDGYK